MKNSKYIPTFESFISKINEDLSRVPSYARVAAPMSASEKDVMNHIYELHRKARIDKSRTPSEALDKVKSILDSIVEKYPDWKNILSNTPSRTDLLRKGQIGVVVDRYVHIVSGMEYFNDNIEEVLTNYINEVKKSMRNSTKPTNFVYDIDSKLFAKDLIKNTTIKVRNLVASLDDLSVLVVLDDKTKLKYFGGGDVVFPRLKVLFGDGFYRKIGGLFIGSVDGGIGGLAEASGSLVVYFGEATIHPHDL